jgi:hypothetical protein
MVVDIDDEIRVWGARKIEKYCTVKLSMCCKG